MKYRRGFQGTFDDVRGLQHNSNVSQVSRPSLTHGRMYVLIECV